MKRAVIPKPLPKQIKSQEWTLKGKNYRINGRRLRTESKQVGKVSRLVGNSVHSRKIS